MSIIKFTIKEEHFKLLKFLRWTTQDDSTLISLGHDGEDLMPLFGEDNKYQAIDIILNGFDGKEIEPESLGDKEYTQEQKDEWDNLMVELSTVLEITLQCVGRGELPKVGEYKAKFHLREWKKI